MSGTFTIEANRTWGLVPGVNVQLDAVALQGPVVVDDDGRTIDGPAALVTVTRLGGTPERRWLRVGDTVDLAGQVFKLERVWDRGRRSTLANPPAAGPLPAGQSGRVATFVPAAHP
jgi:hypothetical protein